jgi:hypothetical protein
MGKRTETYLLFSIAGIRGASRRRPRDRRPDLLRVRPPRRPRTRAPGQSYSAAARSAVRRTRALTRSSAPAPLSSSTSSVSPAAARCFVAERTEERERERRNDLGLREPAAAFAFCSTETRARPSDPIRRTRTTGEGERACGAFGPCGSERAA